MNLNDNLLQGRWQVESQYRAEDGRWLIYAPVLDCVWRFRLRSSCADPSEDTAEDLSGSPQRGYITQDQGKPSEFYYFPNVRKLHAFGNERLRVEQTAEDQLALYDLEDVAVEPDEYYFRLILKRIP